MPLGWLSQKAMSPLHGRATSYHGPELSRVCPHRHDGKGTGGTSQGLGLPMGSHGVTGEDCGLGALSPEVGGTAACLLGHKLSRPATSHVAVCAHVCARVDGWARQGGFAFLLGARQHQPGERACSPAPPGPQVWSITYHSWLTFCVLLLWACLSGQCAAATSWPCSARPSSCSMGWRSAACVMCGHGPAARAAHRPGPRQPAPAGAEHTRYPCLDLCHGESARPPPGSQCGGHAAAQGPHLGVTQTLAKASIVAQLVFVK